MKLKTLFLLTALSVVLSGCGVKSGRNLALEEAIDQAEKNNQTGLANPASANCQEQGGKLSIVAKPDGGQYGLCLFEDSRQCEEWALLRGDCPAGGLKITGYDNEAQIYCAVTGGQVLMNRGVCQFKNYSVCEFTAYYNGVCSPETTTESDVIRVSQPTAGQAISSPLKITGEARGTWYFEASFPVKLLDSDGQELAAGVAQAKGEWMTENFVPFEVTLNFKQPTTASGQIVLIKDNPSGLPEHEAQIGVPVKFR